MDAGLCYEMYYGIVSTPAELTLLLAHEAKVITLPENVAADCRRIVKKLLKNSEERNG